MLAVLGTVVLAASLIGLFAWSPWVKPSELEWLGTYETWSGGIEESLDAVSRTTCE